MDHVYIPPGIGPELRARIAAIAPTLPRSAMLPGEQSPVRWTHHDGRTIRAVEQQGPDSTWQLVVDGVPDDPTRGAVFWVAELCTDGVQLVPAWRFIDSRGPVPPPDLDPVRIVIPAVGATQPIIVTRHAGLVQYLREIGLATSETPVLPHATADDVRSRHVIGVLPMHLAAVAETVTEVPIRHDISSRSGELCLDDVRARAGAPVTYVVRIVERR